MNILKKLLIGLAIALSIPTVSAGSSFVVSLIQGKTAQEAVIILAEQVDGILSRIGAIEQKQLELEQIVATSTAEIEILKGENEQLSEKLGICREIDKLWDEMKRIPGMRSNSISPDDMWIKAQEELRLRESYVANPYQPGNGYKTSKYKDDDLIKYKDDFDKKLPELLIFRKAQLEDFKLQLTKLSDLKAQYDSMKSACDK